MSFNDRNYIALLRNIQDSKQKIVKKYNLELVDDGSCDHSNYKFKDYDYYYNKYNDPTNDVWFTDSEVEHSNQPSKALEEELNNFNELCKAQLRELKIVKGLDGGRYKQDPKRIEDIKLALHHEYDWDLEEFKVVLISDEYYKVIEL